MGRAGCSGGTRQRTGGGQHLGGVCLFQLLLVLLHLVLMLGAQLLQRVCQPALKLSLLPVVDLHEPGLVPALGLTQFLKGLSEDT